VDNQLDAARENVNISATQIRKNVFEHLKHLPPVVFNSYMNEMTRIDLSKSNDVNSILEI
jgi:hypothetical protein